MKIPIPKIGEVQEIDILKSSGGSLCGGFGQVCTVIKTKKSFDDRGDNPPLRMAELFWGDWWGHNKHYTPQTAGCPLSCWCCYVDNLKEGKRISAEDVVSNFYSHWRIAYRYCLPKINVLNLIGGAPGRYPKVLGELRKEMDNCGFEKKILFSDVIFVESYFYVVKPTGYINTYRFLLTGCLKGTNRINFLENTGKDLFYVALNELEKYTKNDNFYLSLINYGVIKNKK